jgi:hypothetical protein
MARYRLRIDVFTPATIPMARLAEYMRVFAAVLGQEHAVHFEALEEGSLQLVTRVDREDVPKIQDRLTQIDGSNAAPDLLRHVEALNQRLAEDNAEGALFEERDGESTKVIVFPGRNRRKPTRYGPINQEGSLDGVLVSIGGVDETISLQLQNESVRYTHCETTRDIARHLAKHLFEPVRILGVGRWAREADGKWTLLKFRVRSFEVLKKTELKHAVSDLRAIKNSDWANVDDPLAKLAELRHKGNDIY